MPNEKSAMRDQTTWLGIGFCLAAEDARAGKNGVPKAPSPI
jgi:hypothetical protein